MLVYILAFFALSFVVVLIIIHTAPEYIEDENGRLWSKDDYEKLKNPKKKKQ